MMQFINSFGHEGTVREHRIIVGLEKRCRKFEEGNPVTLTSEIQNKLLR